MKCRNSIILLILHASNLNLQRGRLVIGLVVPMGFIRIFRFYYENEKIHGFFRTGFRKNVSWLEKIARNNGHNLQNTVQISWFGNKVLSKVYYLNQNASLPKFGFFLFTEKAVSFYGFFLSGQYGFCIRTIVNLSIQNHTWWERREWKELPFART